MSKRILVILVNGIGENNGGVLRRLENFLPKDRYEIIALPYKADYGPAPGLVGLPFEQTLIDARSLLLRWCRSVHRNRVIVLVGYSAGAQIVGDVAAELARSGDRAGVVGAVMLSDPSQPKGLAPGGKYGVRGSRTIPGGIAAEWWFDINDVICCCTPPPKSLIRVFADHSSEFSLAGPRAWSATLVRLKVKQFQSYLPGGKPEDIRMRIAVARHEAEGYLVRGDHTSYHIRKNSDGVTYIESIANWIKKLKA
ncbi:lysin B [Gordonia phage Camerico]|nr:lysin B [Gordonia phage Camerico]